MKRILILIPFIILCVILLLNVREITDRNVIPPGMPGLKGDILKSTTNGKSYRLYVSLPLKYDPADSLRYPVLYLLDGNYTFPLIDGTRKVLDLGHEIEDLIIVAIGDSVQAGPGWTLSRTFDYTPSCDDRYDSINTKSYSLIKGAPKSGGAKSFLKTVERDIIPFIDRHYKTTTDRGIAGHSLGGLFAGYCLLAAPGLFTRYGINSPSFWWNSKEILTLENSFVKEHSELNAKVFISVGNLEPGIMTTDMTDFTNVLYGAHYKDLILTSQIFDNETHLSAMPVSLTRTLRVLYGAKQK